MEPRRDEDGSSKTPDQPPFLSTWRNVYVLVAVELVVTIALLYALTRWAS